MKRAKYSAGRITLGRVRVWICAMAFMSGLGVTAHASTSDPYASVGARVPFNKSNSLDLAQYCNGADQLDDTSCIGRWISDGRAQGKHLYASPGTYLYSSNRRLFNGVQIRCADPKTTVFKNIGGSRNFFVMSSSMGVPDHPYEDIRIENCGFDMNGATANFASIISIGGDSSSPETMARNITIRGNRVFDSTQPGSMYVERDRQRQYIVVISAQDVLIEGNQLSEGGRIKAGRPGTRIVIRNNTLHNVNDNGITVVNTQSRTGSHYRIENNTVVNALGSGIFFGSDGQNTGTPDQLIEDVIIRNNRISGIQVRCILGTLPNHARRIVIDGNDCRKNNAESGGAGVSIIRASNSVLPIEDLTIRNNTFVTESGGTFSSGIFINNYHANTCAVGNQFSIGQTTGIQLHQNSSGSIKLAGNVLNGSTFSNRGTMSVDSSGSTEGCFGMTASGPAPDTTAPSVPKNLTATPASSSQVDLSWSASTDNVGVAGYRVYRNGARVATVSGTSHQDKNLSASTTYSYQVSAFDAAGNESVGSFSVTATTLAPPDTSAPSIPQNLNASAASSSQVNLTWSASTDNVGVTGYKVYRNDKHVGTASSTGFQDKSLAAGTSYSYRVSAVDAAGNESTRSAAATATTRAAADVTPPEILDLKVSKITRSSALITWKTNERAHSRVHYGTDLGSMLANKNLRTSHSFKLANLKGGTLYYFRVTSVDAAGNAGRSAIMSFVTPRK
jgi:chitodextrinase